MVFDPRKEFDKFARADRNISSRHLYDYYNFVQPRALTPYIIEERPLHIAQMDVFSRLMMDRIIFLGDALTDYFSNIIIAQLLFLDSVDKVKDIQMYINCPGGVIYSGLGIYDTMQYVAPDVATICVGMAASMGAVMMCAGEQGKRTALAHARFMLHQPSGGVGGQASDIEIMAREIKSTQEALYAIIAQHTDKDIEDVRVDCDRDRWMSAQEAKDYGLIDDILSAPEKKKAK